jgi:hypothetical protein
MILGGNANKKVPYSTEDKVDNPVSLYATTKKSKELMAHAYSELYQSLEQDSVGIYEKRIDKKIFLLYTLDSYNGTC